jgi:nucleoside-diphosphate-sugar epimerase
LVHEGASYQPISGSVDKKPFAIIGGTGFVGRALVERWPEHERSKLRLIIRRSRPSWMESYDLNVHATFGDDGIVEAISGTTAVVNLLRPPGDGSVKAITARIAAQAGEVGVRRLIHCSSIDVYGGVSADWVDEETIPQPRTPYEREHLASEESVALAPVESCIVRLGAIFGTGGQNLVALAREVQNGARVTQMARRALYGTRRMHLVSVEKVADALRFLAYTNRSLYAERILLTDDDAPENNFAYVQDVLLRSFGRAPLAWMPALPDSLLAAGLWLRRRSNPRRRFATRKLGALGFQSTETFRMRLDKYADALSRTHTLAAP